MIKSKDTESNDTGNSKGKKSDEWVYTNLARSHYEEALRILSTKEFGNMTWPQYANAKIREGLDADWAKIAEKRRIRKEIGDGNE